MGISENPFTKIGRGDGDVSLVSLEGFLIHPGKPSMVVGAIFCKVLKGGGVQGEGVTGEP